MLLRWWKEYKEKKDWQQFRKMYELHKQAEQFTSMRCPFCDRAAHSPEANFCHNCGTCFHHTDPQQTVPSLHTTGPISLRERPFHAYRHELQRRQQQDVADYPTRKFPAPPRRPLRTVRLEGREHFG